MEMIKSVISVMLLVVIIVKSDEDYIDPVIDMLLNGVSIDITQSDEDLNGVTEKEPVSTGGIWKCGNCTLLGEAEMVMGDGPDMGTLDTMDIQISLYLEHMRCVTVVADRPGAVRKVLGSCIGSSVTLNVSPSHNFTIFVYK